MSTRETVLDAERERWVATLRQRAAEMMSLHPAGGSAERDWREAVAADLREIAAKLEV